MDLVYADKNRVDVGILQDFNFDLAYGEDENNFELTLPITNNVLEEDFWIYIEGTEYGGIIDSIEVDTTQKVVKYRGRTYHGLLDKKILEPFRNQDYMILSGDLNFVLGNIISLIHLEGIFKASSETTINVTSYKFDRYVSAYTGIKRMLASVDYKLKMEYKDGFVELSAVPLVSYDSESIDSDKFGFLVKRTHNFLNHLICLGSGNLKDRQVVHLYLDEDGNISTTQVFTGIDEIVETYDYANAESIDDLTQKGKEKLKGQKSTTVDLDLGSEYVFDIGDKITVSEIVTGIEVKQIITKKIVTINKDVLKINYSVGE